MIQPQEIRVGNWFTSDFFDDLPPDENPYHEFKAISVMLGELNQSVWIDMSYYPKSVNLKDLKPIPITEEWLKKFGFGVSMGSKEMSQWSNKESTVILQFDGNYYLTHFGIVTGRDKNLNTPIVNFININRKYVHELQNLHYELMGKEL